jgi:hypothetical protein
MSLQKALHHLRSAQEIVKEEREKAKDQHEVGLLAVIEASTESVAELTSQYLQGQGLVRQRPTPSHPSPMATETKGGSKG